MLRYCRLTFAVFLLTALSVCASPEQVGTPTQEAASFSGAGHEGRMLRFHRGPEILSRAKRVSGILSPWQSSRERFQCWIG